MDRKRFIIVPKCQTHSSQNPNEILDTKPRTRKCYVWCCSTSCNTRQIFPLHTGNQMQFVAAISCGFIKSVRSETLLQFFSPYKASAAISSSSHSGSSYSSSCTVSLGSALSENCSSPCQGRALLSLPSWHISKLMC